MPEYLRDLSPGDIVKDVGWKYKDRVLTWRVVSTNQNSIDSKYPANTVTLVSNTSVGNKEFSVGQSSFPDPIMEETGSPKEKGYAQFDTAISCIHDWLNSSDTSWADNFPNKPSYFEEKGFEGYMTDKFKNNIVKTSIEKYRYDNVFNYNGKVTEDLDIFLLSMGEIGLSSRTDKENYQIFYFHDKDVRKFHDENGTLVNYWLRTPVINFPTSCYVGTTTGVFAQCLANLTDKAVIPALSFKDDVKLANNGVPDSDGAYILALNDPIDWDTEDTAIKDKFDPNNIKEITDNEIFENAQNVQPTWNEIDGAVSSVKLFFSTSENPTSEISFQKDNILSNVGYYKIELTYSDSTFIDNTFIKTINFRIKPAILNLEKLIIKDANTNTVIDDSDGIENFYGLAIPTWIIPDGTTIDCSLLKGIDYSQTVSNNFQSGTQLTIPDSYKIIYTLTDNNYSDNQLSDSTTFKILIGKVNWDTFNLNLRDSIKNDPVTDGKDFTRRIKLDWDEQDNVTYNFTLSCNSSNVENFNKNDLLETVGSYSITFHLIDKNYNDNTKDITINFTISAIITDLNNFNLIFKNKSDNYNIFAENEIFKDKPVCPTWDELPIDVTVAAYILLKDNVQIPFEKDISILTEYAKYSLIVSLRNGSNDSKEYTRNFSIETANIDLSKIDFNFYNMLDNTIINDGREFIDESVKPNWKDPGNIILLNYSMTIDGEDYYFIQGSTVVSKYATYTITLNFEELGNPSNTASKTITFIIRGKATDLDKLNVNIINSFTGITINNNDIFKDEDIHPFWEIEDQPQTVSSTGKLSFNNGDLIDYNMSDMEQICHEIGNYLLQVILLDSVTNLTRTIIVTFKIVHKEQDLSELEILIKNKLTNLAINEGEIFRGDISVQPTWEEVIGIDYSYKLYYNSVIESDYQKENILNKKGYYKLEVTAYDPNYPNNNITNSVSFSIMEKINGDEFSNTDAYLNGLPFKLGTPITKSGDYNLLVIRKKDSNFKISSSEVNFKIIDPTESQDPYIEVDPNVIPSISDDITIYYPIYSTEQEYKINSNGVWKNYSNKFEVTNNCIIYARCKDNSGYIAQSFKEIINIDKLPPDPPIILGFKDNINTYYTVAPIAQYVDGINFTATLNGEPYILGNPIYNENEEIKKYTLIVTATKRINKLTSSTTVVFYLDSIPPALPIITGVIPNQIQTEATPNIVPIESNPNVQGGPMDLGLDYESKLNNLIYNLGTKLTEDNNYELSVTAIKRVNGLRSSSIIIFTIMNNIPDIISPIRIKLKPLIEENKDYAIDGELVVDKNTGHISLYDDGNLISKTKELEDLLNKLFGKINKITIKLNGNDQRIKLLRNMRNNAVDNLNIFDNKNFEVQNDINNINNSFDNFSFESTDIINKFKEELNEIELQHNKIANETSSLSNKIEGKSEDVINQINSLISNSSIITQIQWLKNNPYETDISNN